MALLGTFAGCLPEVDPFTSSPRSASIRAVSTPPICCAAAFAGIDRRFEAYCEEISEALEPADRRAPAQWYLKRLILPGERKSVEPMAARVYPDNVRSRISRCIIWLPPPAGRTVRCWRRHPDGWVPELLKAGHQCWLILMTPRM